MSSGPFLLVSWQRSVKVVLAYVYGDTGQLPLTTPPVNDVVTASRAAGVSQNVLPLFLTAEVPMD
jgi:hypothetical protein